MKSFITIGLLLAAASAFGQNGTIAGTVKDPVGKVAANVNVTATNTATNTPVRASSGKDGAYSIGNLPPGSYDLTAQLGGVAPFSKKGIAVAAGTAVRIDISLAEGSQLSTLGEDSTAIAADALRHHPPTGPTPKTAEGKPDLSGVWWGQRVVDPGKPEFLPAAQEVARKRQEDNRKDSPQAHCMPSAATRTGPLWALVQSKDLIVQLSDDDSPGAHQIHMDGRPHPKEPDPLWYGDNIGHWEGDWLVVDRVNFDEKAWLDQDGHPHSDQLHIIDKFHRTDLGHLEEEVTVEDPGILVRPYTIKRTAELAPGEEIREFICSENNKDEAHLVGK